MASTYAHFRFGNAVYVRLPESVKKIIQSNKKLYFIGQHGPDIFFYYRPFGKNPVNQFGFAMHKKSGREVFTELFDKVQRLDGMEKKELESYILGFLCHFALDKHCHPFIEDWMQKTGLSHAEIEVEFDRAMLEDDGFDPIHTKLTEHISTEKADAVMIQKLFPEFTVKQIRKSLVSMRFYNDFLVAPGEVKRAIIGAVLTVTGNSREMAGHLVNKKRNEKCDESTKALYELYDQAVEEALEMIVNMAEAFETGELQLNDAFDHTFGVD